MGTLYLVATPIGNLEDMSLRAVRILKESALIAAEDTRHTGKLLKHFEIDTPLTSYFEHNKLNKLDFILEKLAGGDVALVSDAGTPAINDPGYELVQAALASGLDVVPIPGSLGSHRRPDRLRPADRRFPLPWLSASQDQRASQETGGSHGSTLSP